MASVWFRLYFYSEFPIFSPSFENSNPSFYNTLKISNEFKIGLLTVTAILFLFFGFNFLKGKNVFSRYQRYYIKYPNVNGLTTGNPIMINGLIVGKVKSIRFLDFVIGEIVVEAELEKDIKLNDRCAASIVNSDILGSKAIKIELGISKKMLKSGDTLRTGFELSITEEITARTAPLLAKMDTLFFVFSGQRMQNIIKKVDTTLQVFQSFGRGMDQVIADNNSRFNNILRHIESISINLDSNNYKIKNILTNLNVFSDSLARLNVDKTLRQTDRALAGLEKALDKINRGEGSIGLLFNDDKLYNQLKKAGEDLDGLVNDIKKNPKRYVHFSVFGGGKEKEEEGKK